MNACEVERIDIWPRHEPVRLIELVVARSRGHAKSLFLRKNAKRGIEWTDIKSVRLVAKDVDHPEGIVGEDAKGLRLWAICERVIYNDPEAAALCEEEAREMERLERGVKR